ncbi:thrombomodulin [Gymnodraco acuticeps]|uniref:Thrombomodulin n=1 Tax=Gymnodraco acuticeps TaxID=8218 RepID=A0A6P8V3U3_GYMAC|nr:thrombomodulin [Gymnodraco acuticeps]
MRDKHLPKQTGIWTDGTHEILNGHNRGLKMKEVTRHVVFLLTFLMGSSSGIELNSGYCLGTQCFSVSGDPSDFTTARDQCRDRGGHLMTVRSSVSQDVLNILLGNITGRFWIGLHLPAGCPDPAADLRGFQWVTKDSESDFLHWAQSFDSSCTAHACVSVSEEDDFKWTQEPCAEHAAGFLCEYSFSDPCRGLAAAEGEYVLYTTPMGFMGEDLLSLPLGSTAVLMPAETNYVCFNKEWIQAPWTCEIHEGGCEHKCTVNANHESTCYCPLGQTVNPANNVTCEVMVDDPCLPLRCAHACIKNGDSYECTCEQGYKLAQDGRSCVDLNDCRDERQCPGENFLCVNYIGGFQCVCMDGYAPIGDQCVDVDECASAPCEHLCDNTPGSYACSCYDGYKADPKSMHKCKLHCGVEECPAECDPNDKFQCYCPEGYISEERGEHTVCIDMDECENLYCDQACKNTFGGYVCSCYPWYTLVGEFACVKNEDGTDGGSGEGTTPSIPTAPPVPHPDPTRQPSAVTVGGLVAIIVCTVFFIVLVVFLAHHTLSGKGKLESSREMKAAEEEAHGLQTVASDA